GPQLRRRAPPKMPPSIALQRAGWTAIEAHAIVYIVAFRLEESLFERPQTTAIRLTGGDAGGRSYWALHATLQLHFKTYRSAYHHSALRNAQSNSAQAARQP